METRAMWRRRGCDRKRGGGWGRVAGCCILAWCGLAIMTASSGRAGDRATTRSPAGARDVVEAMAALAACDAAIDVAGSTACGLERLPATRAEILPLLPGEHRRLLEECARGRLRLKRRQVDFDLIRLIDEAADRPECVATVRAFFAARPVDVAIGVGLSDGPYPIAFDWAVVLDPRSGTLFSFVLNCRD